MYSKWRTKLDLTIFWGLYIHFRYLLSPSLSRIKLKKIKETFVERILKFD